MVWTPLKSDADTAVVPLLHAAPPILSQCGRIIACNEKVEYRWASGTRYVLALFRGLFDKCITIARD